MGDQKRVLLDALQALEPHGLVPAGLGQTGEAQSIAAVGLAAALEGTVRGTGIDADDGVAGGEQPGGEPVGEGAGLQHGAGEALGVGTERLVEGVRVGRDLAGPEHRTLRVDDAELGVALGDVETGVAGHGEPPCWDGRRVASQHDYAMSLKSETSHAVP